MMAYRFYRVSVGMFFLPEDHPLYLDYKWTVIKVTISMLVKELGTHKLCCGVNATEHTGKLFHHVMPLDDEGEGTNSGKDDEISVQFPHKGYWRVKDCWLMYDKEDSECAACTEYMEYVKMQVKQKRGD